jgi:hypothetical protein
MALPPATGEAHHFPVAGVSIGELALLDRTAARRVELHQGVVAFVGVDRYQYVLIAHVSSSSNGRLEGEAGQCNLRRSKALFSHFLTGWGPDGRRPFKSQSAHRRRQPIIEQHHLVPTLKDRRPSSSQGRSKQVAEYLLCGRQRKADALASDIPNYGRLRMQLGLRRGRGGVVMASI